MFQIFDTSSEIYRAYGKGGFSLQQWEKYIEMTIPQVKNMCLSDMQKSVSPDYSWDEYYLPVLNGVIQDKEEFEKAVEAFKSITDGLEQKIIERFGKSLNVDIVLYLGLCNGAGWVEKINEKHIVLLGIEKILELKWNNIDDMTGLILHELGHVYQAEYGVLYRQFKKTSDHFLWQLFTEGIAMVFEQEIVNDSSYFHQDKDGWKIWCDQNISKIANDFESDYQTMTFDNQRYFGDWVRYKGHYDVGYYLGACFVRFILDKDEFDNIISYDIDEVRHLFYEFVLSV